ncbi:hypothetical protein HanIR_Chr11g0526961 [Helianthus annuus]|nr:hypothetical protein HanIR_Chr11g0526961 [Helianthus annuus]
MMMIQMMLKPLIRRHTPHSGDPKHLTSSGCLLVSTASPSFLQRPSDLQPISNILQNPSDLQSHHRSAKEMVAADISEMNGESRFCGGAVCGDGD